jgi:uncharacterized protein (DUF488 family)
MNDATIYSIGHGKKDIDVFIAELQDFQIEFLLDIRSKPFSKWNPQFNQAELRCSLENNQIKYVHMGDSLGGLPSDRSCYNSDGKIVYSLVKEKEFFKAGLQRLLAANEKKINIAIMCSESKPEECHRSKLIGQELLHNDISIKHITSEGTIKSQEDVISKLTKGRATIDLFGESIDFSSRKSY